MTKIEWCDRTWNPVTGCTKVSAGCKHCYAEVMAKRTFGRLYDLVHDGYKEGGGKVYRTRRFTDVQCHPDRLDAPLRWRKPSMVFVNSMSDLFHEDVPDEFIHRVFAVMSRARQHTFQVLSKRPERMGEYLTHADVPWCIACEAERLNWAEDVADDVDMSDVGLDAWPLPNVWLGVSVEDQATADARIPLLLQTPAAVRFVSLEPCLGPVDLSKWLVGERAHERSRAGVSGLREHRGLFDRRSGTHLEAQAPDRRQPQRDAAVLEGTTHEARGAVGVGRVSDGHVLGRSEATQGLRSPSGLDVLREAGHSPGDAGQPQERRSPGYAPRQPGDGDGFREHDPRHPGSRSQGAPSIRGSERGIEADRSAGRSDQGVGREDEPVQDRRDVRGEAGDHLGRHPQEELGAPGVTLDWVIVGGESGPKARPCDVAWIRSAVQQCLAAGVRVFVKQLGAHIITRNDDGWEGDTQRSWPMDTSYREDDQGALVRVRLRDRKGGDPAEWPEDLRVREWPEVRA